jgi:hypothetical protein
MVCLGLEKNLIRPRQRGVQAWNALCLGLNRVKGLIDPRIAPGAEPEGCWLVIKGTCALEIRPEGSGVL